MATLQTAPMLGIKASRFHPAGDRRQAYGLADVAGPNGTVVAFICNHCPYVKAVADRMVADARTLAAEGIGFVAICANDPVSHPADSFDNMKLFAETHGFSFPYLQDESQTVARAYDAACTPEFYGLDAAGTIAYHGRLDEGRTEPLKAGARREMLEAMRMIARTGKGPAEQLPAIELFDQMERGGLSAVRPPRREGIRQARLPGVRSPAVSRAGADRTGQLGLEGREQHHDHGLAYGHGFEPSLIGCYIWVKTTP